MLSLIKDLFRDEAGYILSAEAVVLGTVGVVGASVGLSSIAYSINEELKETAFSLRSLNQSYAIKGFRGHGSYTAGSTFIQKPVEEAHADLQLFIDDLESELQREAKSDEHDEKDDDKKTESKKSDDKPSKKKKDGEGKKKAEKKADKDSRWDDEI
jgi:hypothetical protein